MNDLDSSDEDLPEQERNFLFDNINSNLRQSQQGNEQFRPEKTKNREYSKVSKFREIRFKSIEEIN